MTCVTLIVTPSPWPKSFFPFAGYTSAVGVHTSLLAFSALFLPRTTEIIEFLKPAIDPSQLTSRDRPQHPFLDALTMSPVSTLACICVGAAIWWIDFALEGSSIEKRIDKALIDQRKNTTLGNAWLTTVAGSLIFHGVLVLFGAPITSHLWQTYLLALLLSILTVFPPAYTLGSPLLAPKTEAIETRMTWIRLFAEFSVKTSVERAILYPAVGTILGCWLGAIPIALDWDRPWQAWPLTPTFGAVVGYILSSVVALMASATRYLADENIRSMHAAKIKTS
ncbi:GPI biosynthesis protein family Pig-F-domain-containing protein [Mycena sp. CBHHK59/15]|nr:GPI biosynthesis protein family Pig-F-domain-containing protein [Mycena sp. CBHHK59/15]